MARKTTPPVMAITSSKTRTAMNLFMALCRFAGGPRLGVRERPKAWAAGCPIHL